MVTIPLCQFSRNLEKCKIYDVLQRYLCSFAFGTTANFNVFLLGFYVID